MDKSRLRLINVVMLADSISNCQKLLNLDINSYFLCLLNLVEEAAIEYKDINDYSYLEKIADYLEKSYQKLNRENKELHRNSIITIRKIYKKLMKTLTKKERKYFDIVYLTLGSLLLRKRKVIEEFIYDDIDLYDLIYEIIFVFKKLDYLDKVIEKCPNVLNSSKFDNHIFIDVINEYINSISLNLEKNILYYERIINKFLLEETFDLDNQMRDYIIKILNNFISSKDNLNCNNLKRIKKVMECIYKKAPLFELFNIKLTEEKIENIEETKPNFKKRLILDDNIITIDDYDALVLDDGISYQKLENGNTLFKVHIADPLAIIPYNSSVINEAKLKTSSIYLPNKTIHMLPNILSIDKLSLNKEEGRCAKTFCFEFSSNFDLVNFYILNTIIKVSDRLTYDSLNDLYKNGASNQEQDKMLSYYNDLINALKYKFQDASHYVHMKQKNKIGQPSKIDSFSENLISYSMILTGYTTANYFNNHNLPYVYRCHVENHEWLNYLNNYIHHEHNNEYKNVLKYLKGILPKSYYSKENKGHMGLGIDAYSHTTSPLRRFSDLLNIHLIDECYFKEASDKTIYSLEDEIDKTCHYINLQTNTIDEYLNNKSKIKEL